MTHRPPRARENGGTGRPLAPSAAAQRQRAYRRRRRAGVAVLSIPVDEFVVEHVLIRSRYLAADASRAELEQAFSRFVDATFKRLAGLWPPP
jgi:hypothetical protein